MRKDQISRGLFERAKGLMPGGVNSPVRAFRAVGMEPPFIQRGDGSHIFDMDGNEYIDYVCSWGPLILGHRHPRVMEAIKAALERGTTFGAPTDLEVELASMIVEAIPSVEMVRMVNSGTEATMAAIRLARGYTGRDKVIKFSGCYHGHSDGLLVKAGSGGFTFGIPDSQGVPGDYARNTITLPFNDLDSVRRVMDEIGNEVACIIVEPVAGNMGVVPPKEGFLEGLRRVTQERGALLIFDEVITGFRVSYNGAQGLYNVTPDLTCLGKIIGGGLPVGAYGGRREIMEAVAPLGGVYQAGTLSGNPLAVSAGIATLTVLREEGVYEDLERKGAYVEEGLREASSRAGVPLTINRVGSMLCAFFVDGKVWDYESASHSDVSLYARFFREMLGEGIYLAPSQFEAMFISTAHSDADLERTKDTILRSFERIG